MPMSTLNLYFCAFSLFNTTFYVIFLILLSFYPTDVLQFYLLLIKHLFWLFCKIL